MMKVSKNGFRLFRNDLKYQQKQAPKTDRQKYVLNYRHKNNKFKGWPEMIDSCPICSSFWWRNGARKKRLTYERILDRRIWSTPSPEGIHDRISVIQRLLELQAPIEEEGEQKMKRKKWMGEGQEDCRAMWRLSFHSLHSHSYQLASSRASALEGSPNARLYPKPVLPHPIPVLCSIYWTIEVMLSHSTVLLWNPLSAQQLHII